MDDDVDFYFISPLGAILVGFLGMKWIRGLGLLWFPLHGGYEGDWALKVAGFSSSLEL
jgi:hypothetical protein